MTKEGDSVFDSDRINRQIEKLEFAEEMAIGFLEWVKLHCDWVCSTSNHEDKWGWETDIPEYDGLYDTKELYQLYLKSKQL